MSPTSQSRGCEKRRRGASLLPPARCLVLVASRCCHAPLVAYQEFFLLGEQHQTPDLPLPVLLISRSRWEQRAYCSMMGGAAPVRRSCRGGGRRAALHLLAAVCVLQSLSRADGQAPATTQGCPAIKFDTPRIQTTCRLATVCTTCITEMGAQLGPQISAYVEANPAALATITEVRSSRHVVRLPDKSEAVVARRRVPGCSRSTPPDCRHSCWPAV